MPSAPPTLCVCGMPKQGGRCPRCGSRKHKQTTGQRGYDYQWQRFRAWYLRDHPLCEDCMAKGIVTAASELHHKHKVKDAPHLRLESTNVVGLCGECHDARTAKGE